MFFFNNLLQTRLIYFSVRIIKQSSYVWTLCKRRLESAMCTGSIQDYGVEICFWFNWNINLFFVPLWNLYTQFVVNHLFTCTPCVTSIYSFIFVNLFTHPLNLNHLPAQMFQSHHSKYSLLADKTILEKCFILLYEHRFAIFK